jgi:hypothetical protein
MASYAAEGPNQICWFSSRVRLRIYIWAAVMCFLRLAGE